MKEPKIYQQPFVPTNPILSVTGHDGKHDVHFCQVELDFLQLKMYSPNRFRAYCSITNDSIYFWSDFDIQSICVNVVPDDKMLAYFHREN